MNLIPCPNCSLLRAEADTEAPCPLCGFVPGSELPLVVDAPSIIEAPAPIAIVPKPAPRSPIWFIASIGITFGLLLGIGLGWWLAREAEPVQQIAQDDSEVDRIPLPSAPIIALAPVVVYETLPPPHEPTEVAPPPMLAADPQPIPIVLPPPGGISVIRLDRPKEIFQLDRVGEGNHIKLIGKVTKLSLDGIANGATVDASELETKSISVKGAIQTGATLRLYCPNGNVSFSRFIDGGSRVEINAPGGTVMFTGSSMRTNGASIDGGSSVKIVCRSASFTAPIMGDKTKIALDLVGPGTPSLKFTEIGGSAQLHYRVPEPNTPTPRITPGKLTGKGECKRLD